MARILRSLRLLAADPETILFAGIAAAAMIVPVAILLKAVLADPDAMLRPPPPGSILASHGPYALLLMIFFPCVAVGTLMNVAVIGCIAKRLEGGEPTAWDGFRAIGGNLRSFFEIALLTFAGLAILLFLADLLESGESSSGKTNYGGRALIGASSETLSAASAFVLCILIVERCGFVQAVRRAVELKSKFVRILVFSVTADWLVGILPVLWVSVATLAIFQDWLPRLSLQALIALETGVPVVLFIGSAVVLAILNLSYICAVYLAASRGDAATHDAIAKFFPEALAAVGPSA